MNHYKVNLMLKSFISKNKLILLYGVSLALLLALLKFLELKFIIMQNAYEIYSGLTALIFMGVGIWLALKLAKPKKEFALFNGVKELNMLL